MAGVYLFMPGTETKVAVFIDYQNLYHGTRELFGVRKDPPTLGNFFPLRLGQLLCDLGREVDAKRMLASVRVYRGQPVNGRSSEKVCRSFDRQVRQWHQTPGVEVLTRPPKYLRDSDSDGTLYWAGREKGVDVMMALDISIGARTDSYDTAVVATADTDFIPALEDAAAVGKRVETATWWTPKSPRGPLRVPGRNIWNHNLGKGLFDVVRDDTDYLAEQ